jgi:hypothetical protein
VTDNGSAFKSETFRRFIASRPELVHVRTRYRSPQTNGVVERFNESLKYEHLYREEIQSGHLLAIECSVFRHLYNDVRPHESLGFGTPREAYLATPASPPEPVKNFRRSSLGYLVPHTPEGGDEPLTLGTPVTAEGELADPAEPGTPTAAASAPPKP